jgi:hypothetical protein
MRLRTDAGRRFKKTENAEAMIWKTDESCREHSLARCTRGTGWAGC